MTIEELAETLETEFLVRGYEWSFEDGPRVPTRDEIVVGLEHLAEQTPENHYMAGGRMILVNSDGHKDLYLHIGEIND